MAEEQRPGPARGRANSRKDQREPAIRRKRTVMLTDDSWERLTVHSMRQRVDKSDLVETWVQSNCRRYVIQDRGGAPLPLASASSDDPGDRPVETEQVREILHPFPTAEVEPEAGAGEGQNPPRPAARRRAQTASG